MEDKIGKSKDVLRKLAGDDNLIDAIVAFTEAQMVSNAQLKIMADISKDLKVYFNDKDGFAKEIAKAIKESNEAQTKDLRLQFFGIITAIATIMGILFKMLG